MFLNRSTTRSRGFQSVARVVCLLVCTLQGGFVMGYTELPWPAEIDEPREQQAAEGDFRRIRISTSSFTAEQRKTCKLYLVDYRIRAFTHVKQLSTLPQQRADLLKGIRDVRSDANRRHCYQLVLQELSTVLDTDEIHPASRVNAILVIGDLNSSEYDPIKRTPPVPMPEALDMLLDIVESAEANRTDAMKIAAMVGILRHAKYGGETLAANTQTRVQTAMVKIVSEKTAPNGRTPEGHVWMQRRAIDILAAMRDPGAENGVVTAIYGVIVDRKSSLSLRCTAIEALGKLNHQGGGGIDSKDLVFSLLDFATMACRQEAARLRGELDAAKAAIQRTEQGRHQLAVGQVGHLLPAYKADRSRRRVVYQLVCLRTGLQGDGTKGPGIDRLAGSEMPLVNEMVKTIDDILQAIGGNMDADALAKKLGIGETNLKRLGGAAPTPIQPGPSKTPEKKTQAEPLDVP